jgi:nucleotide-binding universal stress UspA family protein
MTADAASPYGHVACCVESAELSRRAVEEAARVAGGGRLSVVHVVESADGFSGGRTAWSPPADEVEAGVAADAGRWLGPLADEAGGAAVVLVGDDAARRLADWAREEGVDLLVVGPHRHGLAKLLGSFAAGLVREAPCPVLLAVGG